MKSYLLWDPVASLMSQAGTLESQVLFGERVVRQHLSLSTYSQQVCFQGQWRAYPGIMRNCKLVPILSYLQPNAVICSYSAVLEPLNIALPYGTPIHIDRSGKVLFPKEIHPYISSSPFVRLKHVRPLSAELCSDSLCLNAYKCLDFPYLWGGRCFHTNLPESLSHAVGADCSGLMQLLYQVQGIHLPRNACDQYAVCCKVSNFKDLPKGGLVFFQPSNKSKINHVLLKIDNHSLIHASESLKKVVTFRIGKDGEIGDTSYSLSHDQGKVFFGIPKNKKAFF